MDGVNLIRRKTFQHSKKCFCDIKVQYQVMRRGVNVAIKQLLKSYHKPKSSHVIWCQLNNFNLKANNTEQPQMPLNVSIIECARCGPAMENWCLATSGCRLCFVSVIIVFVLCGNFVFSLLSFFYQFITTDYLIIILFIIIIISTILIITTLLEGDHNRAMGEKCWRTFGILHRKQSEGQEQYKL